MFLFSVNFFFFPFCKFIDLFDFGSKKETERHYTLYPCRVRETHSRGEHMMALHYFGCLVGYWDRTLLTISSPRLWLWWFRFFWKVKEMGPSSVYLGW